MTRPTAAPHFNDKRQTKKPGAGQWGAAVTIDSWVSSLAMAMPRRWRALEGSFIPGWTVRRIRLLSVELCAGVFLLGLLAASPRRPHRPSYRWALLRSPNRAVGAHRG